VPASPHEASGFDTALVGYGATGVDGFSIASHALHVTATPSTTARSSSLAFARPRRTSNRTRSLRFPDPFAGAVSDGPLDRAGDPPEGFTPPDLPCRLRADVGRASCERRSGGVQIYVERGMRCPDTSGRPTVACSSVRTRPGVIGARRPAGGHDLPRRLASRGCFHGCLLAARGDDDRNAVKGGAAGTTGVAVPSGV